MKLYVVKDWKKHFEVRDSKRVSGPLSWVAIPTKTDGFGFSRISLEKDPCDLLAAWYLMLGIAAKQEANDRGKLQRDGIPLTAEDLAIITRFPVKAFTRALEFFASPKQAWLECVALDGPCVDHARAIDGPSVDASGPSSVPTGQYRTVQDITNSSAKLSECDIEQIWQHYPKKTGKKVAWPELKAAVKQHGFARILDRTRAYEEAVARWPAEDRCFVPDPIRWYKRGCFDDDPAAWVREKPGQFYKPHATPAAIPEPAGWRDFARNEYADPVFLDPTSPRYAETWQDLDRETQSLISNAITQQS